MLAKATGIPSEEIRAGQIGGNRAVSLMKARVELRRLPILVYDAPGQTLTDIQLRGRVAVRRQKVRLLVIDHLHRIKPAAPMARLSRLDQVAFITESLKDLARTLGVPILLLAQLSRDAERREDPRPVVADVKYAGEADPDNIILLWRPELHMAAEIAAACCQIGHGVHDVAVIRFGSTDWLFGRQLWAGGVIRHLSES
jgi:replicative DNA helicase